MRHLIIKVTAGEDSPERCLQGLTVSAVAAASGAKVSLWLTGEAVWLVTPGRDLTIAESPPASALLEAVLEAGTITVCTQCAARRGITAEGLLPGVTISGAASFVAEVLEPEAQALVY